VGDYNILMQFDIAADPDIVERALTTEDGIRSWWSSRASVGDADRGSGGGELRVTLPDVPQPFEFSTRQSDGAIEWVTGGFPPWWAGTTIRWDVDRNPDGPGVRLLFSHRDYDPSNPVIPIVTPAWAQIILRLKDYAETGVCRPFFDF